MAFKLTAKELQEKEEYSGELGEASKMMSEAQIAATEKISEAIGTFNIAVEKYNDAIKSAESFRQGVADRLRNEYDTKSEKWQEEDEGTAVNEMIEKWEEELDEVEDVESPTVEFPEPDDYASFDDLPTEPE